MSSTGFGAKRLSANDLPSPRTHLIGNLITLPTPVCQSLPFFFTLQPQVGEDVQGSTWSPPAWGESWFGWSGKVCQDVQAQKDQTWLHPRRCWRCTWQFVWQRLLPNDHLSIRGSQPLFQEHLQAEAPVSQVAGGRRLLSMNAICFGWKCRLCTNASKLPKSEFKCLKKCILHILQ